MRAGLSRNEAIVNTPTTRTRLPGWERLLPSWPLIVGLAAFGRLLAEPMGLLNDPDTYLHIAAGNWILAHGALPLNDPFSLKIWAVLAPKNGKGGPKFA